MLAPQPALRVGPGGSQGNRISKHGQDFGEVGIVPRGPLDFASE